jgi:hypothetical protein
LPNFDARRRYAAVSWILSRPLAGTPADTPASLRRKAAEFKRLALGARDPETIAELEDLVWRYLERAQEMESGGHTARQPDRKPLSK